MTDRAKKKEEAKKEIRSLLLSAPVGLTLQELKRDFVQFMGRQLPGRELGYNNAEEFLQDIPDTVEVSWSGHTMMLKGVSNASTKHIQKLVSNQKVTSKKKWGVLRNNKSSPLLPAPGRRGGKAQSWARPEPDMNFTQKQRVGNYTAPPNNKSQPPRFRQQFKQQARHRTLPSVPAYVRNQIYELVENQPDGLPLTHICQIFRRKFGVPLEPLSMGFSCEFDLLASLKDLVALKLLAGGEYRVMSVEAASALSDGKNKLSGQHLNQVYQQSDSGLGTSQELLPLTSHPVGGHRTPTPPSPLETMPHHKEQSLGQDESTANTNGNHVTETESSCNIPLAIQNHIRQIMDQRQKGIFASRLPFEYKNMFKKELPTKTYGYNSVIEFVSDLPHIIRIERPHPQGDWHLYPANSNSSSSTLAGPAVDKKTPRPKKEIQTQVVQIEKNVQEAIAQVLSVCPDGIPLDSFLDTFKAMSGRNLDVSKYSTGGLKQFLHSMPDILYISLDVSDNAIVRSKLFDGPRRFDQLRDQYRPTMASGDQRQNETLHLPSDAVSPGCLYKPQPLPSYDGDEGKYTQLFISNIISPGLFWIQLRGRHTSLALEDFMDEIEYVYTSKHLPKDYHMPPSLTRCGMVCAAIFPEDGFWHRAIITGFKDQLYEVYYVDYGNTCYVSIDQMRLLKSKFLKLPAQAIQARLSNIQPANGVWKNNSKARLLALTREKPLLGIITNVKDGVLSLCLTDTTSDEDIHINDVFVDEGYAVYVPDSEIVEIDPHSQAPSMGLLYGDNRIPTVGQEPRKRFVRQAQMTEDTTMHLINLDGNLYLLSSEISRLFFDQDIISAKLRKDNADVPKVVVCKEDFPGLFQELFMYGAFNVTNSTKMLTLFSLSGMPLILELYGQNGKFEEEMKGTALEILDWFDPEDLYWKGEEEATSGSEGVQEETETQSSVGDSSDVPKLEDLQLVQNSLEIKRKRILNKMLSPSFCTPDSVNELNEVELHIKRVDALIFKLKNDPSSPISGDDVTSLNQNQTKPNSQSTGPTSHGAGATSHSMGTTCQGVGGMHQVKTTQKVAPIIQASSAAAPTSFSTPFPTGSMGDMAALLQQQMMMNRVMMEQLGISQDPASVQSMMRQLPVRDPNPHPNLVHQQQFWPYQPDPAVQVTQSVPVSSLGQPNPFLDSQGHGMLQGQPLFPISLYPSSMAASQQFQDNLTSKFAPIATSSSHPGMTQFPGNSNPSGPNSQTGIPNLYYNGSSCAIDSSFQVTHGGQCQASHGGHPCPPGDYFNMASSQGQDDKTLYGVEHKTQYGDLVNAPSRGRGMAEALSNNKNISQRPGDLG